MTFETCLRVKEYNQQTNILKKCNVRVITVLDSEDLPWLRDLHSFSTKAGIVLSSILKQKINSDLNLINKYETEKGFKRAQSLTALKRRGKQQVRKKGLPDF